MTRHLAVAAALVVGGALGCARPTPKPIYSVETEAAIDSVMGRLRDREMDGGLLLRFMYNGSDSVLIVGHDYHIGLRRTGTLPVEYRVTLYPRPIAEELRTGHGGKYERVIHTEVR